MSAPAAGVSGTGASGTGEGPRWRRLHPVTPVLRSWRVLVVLLAVYAQNRGQDALSAGGRDLPGHVELLVALATLAGSVVLAVAVSAVAWRMTRYAVDDEAVRLHSGVLVRRQRAARLDRLQAVDVVQPLLARLLGFAEVRVEVAGGQDSDIRLAYLREEEAQRLRNTLLARSAGVRYEGEEAPEAVDRPVVEVAMPRLLGSIALSGPAAALVLLVVALVVTAVLTRSPAPLVAAPAPVLGLVAGLWAAFTRSGSWRVSVAADGLRLRHGLLESRTQTVPPGRVQAVRLAQPLLWRRWDWWRLEVNVAGYGGGGARGRGSADPGLLLPVGSRAEAEQVLALVLPGLAAALGERGLDRGLTGTGDDGGWVVAPPTSRWVDLVGWRRHGALVTGPALLGRRGRLRRELDVVPHERTQSLGLSQGPVQRRLGLATLAVHSTPGPVRPTAAHLDTGVAAALLGEQAARARRARAGAGPERWMEALAVQEAQEDRPAPQEGQPA